MEIHPKPHGNYVYDKNEWEKDGLYHMKLTDSRMKK